MDERLRVEHNTAFEKASVLLKGEIPLHERMDMKTPGWWTRRRMNKACTLLKRVLAINPENWSAMWLLGKANQRFGDTDTALMWFEKSYQINPSQPDVAREASLCAMDAGKTDEAVVFSFRATQIEPENAGLQANLALAYLLAGRVSEASGSIGRSLKIDPDDRISQTIGSIIEHFMTNGKEPPRNTSDLLAYWQSNK